MRIDLYELEKVHSAPNAQQEMQPRQQIPTAGRSNHVSMCQLWPGRIAMRVRRNSSMLGTTYWNSSR